MHSKQLTWVAVTALAFHSAACAEDEPTTGTETDAGAPVLGDSGAPVPGIPAETVPVAEAGAPHSDTGSPVTVDASSPGPNGSSSSSDASASDGASFDDASPPIGSDGTSPDAADAGPSIDEDVDGGAGDADSGPSAAPWPRLWEGAVEFPRLAVDASGNAVVVGRLRGSANLGGGELVSAGGTDAVIASFAPNGEHRWSLRFGSSEPDAAMDVATDAESNVYVVGSFRDSVRVAEDRELVAVGDSDVFVTSYTADGQLRFAHSYASESSATGYSVRVDRVGRPVIAGEFSGEMTLGADTLDAREDTSGFVAWLDEDGDPHDSLVLNGSLTAQALALDANGNTTVAVSFNQPFDPGNGEVQPEGRVNAVIVSYDATGALRWAVPLLTPERLSIGRSVVAANGDVIMVGSAEGSLTFGGETLPAPEVRNAFVLRIASDGTPVWSRQLGVSHVQSWDVALLGETIVVAGGYREAASFAGIEFEPLRGIPGGTGGYLAAWHADGTPQWALSFAPSQDLNLTGIAPLPANAGFVVAGTLYGELTIDGRSLAPKDDLGAGLLMFTHGM